ncbi:hypothetical protein LCM20_09655 [Halobacillus litoralis]|uniref:hypothetical protein n=1 Tax=Halobacillus litoralis TaxID=45668 RepID=UPI001CD53E56|nr:hypothetical protein [Halobacillus litoralis]MCA0970855.1 hypothetical protein [Halobacillus litoralis]
MPQSIQGKLSGSMLVIFLLQIVWFVFMMSVNGLGAIVQFITVSSITSVLGLIIGVISLKKERENRMVPILTLIISVLFLSAMLFFLFGYSFGG